MSVRGDSSPSVEGRRYWKFGWNELNALPAIGKPDYQPKPGGAYRIYEEGTFRGEHLEVFPAKKVKRLLKLLSTLGARESGTGKLEEAVAAYREALKERTRERAPLDWAGTQMNLGGALETLGARESGTGKLEEAVAAYREALKERTRERAPLDWARTHAGLGNALRALGARESGTGKLEEAVAAYRRR